MSRRGIGARVVVGLAATLLIGAVAVVAAALFGELAAARATLDDIEPRYARLLGLRAVRPQIDRALVEVGAAVARHAYPASANSDRVGTDLQQRVRRLAEAAGMSVVGSQILPTRAAAGFAQIPVATTVEGTLEGLRGLLLALDADVPSILVDSVVVRTAPRLRAGPASGRLTVQMNLSVLQQQP